MILKPPPLLSPRREAASSQLLLCLAGKALCDSDYDDGGGKRARHGFPFCKSSTTKRAGGVERSQLGGTRDPILAFSDHHPVQIPRLILSRSRSTVVGSPSASR